jgi:hypothetical protein
MGINVQVRSLYVPNNGSYNHGNHKSKLKNTVHEHSYSEIVVIISSGGHKEEYDENNCYNQQKKASKKSTTDGMTISIYINITFVIRVMLIAIVALIKVGGFGKSCLTYIKKYNF